MKHAALIAALAMLATTAAHAQRASNVDGVKLMKACNGSQTEVCDAYLDGFGDAIHAGGKDHALACIPAASTGTELRDVLVTWLRANPQAQHDKAEKIARLAFQKAYPCHR
jgi:hypothetical protein